MILPACLKVYPEGNFIYQQDGAPPHKHKTTQRFLEGQADFIRAADWPGYSPDANPCDYRLNAWLKRKVYEKGMPNNLGELKERIYQVWDELDTETIRGWLRELRPRLEKIVEERGRPIQQYFNKV